MKSDSQGHQNRSRHICSFAITGCAYKISPTFTAFWPRNRWERTQLPAPKQGQLCSHFRQRKKFLFGVLLPLFLHCPSLSWTSLPELHMLLCLPANGNNSLGALLPDSPWLQAPLPPTTHTPFSWTVCELSVRRKATYGVTHNIVWRWTNPPLRVLTIEKMSLLLEWSLIHCYKASITSERNLF